MNSDLQNIYVLIVFEANEGFNFPFTTLDSPMKNTKQKTLRASLIFICTIFKHRPILTNIKSIDLSVKFLFDFPFCIYMLEPEGIKNFTKI